MSGYRGRRYIKSVDRDEYKTYGNACHSDSANIHREYTIVEIYDSKIKGNFIQTLQNWLKLLEGIGIYAKYISDYEDFNHAILFDNTKNVKYKNYNKMLFAYQLVRLGIKRPPFIRKILKMAEKFDNMNAWELTYLTWANQKYTIWDSYFDVFPDHLFEFIELDVLLDNIEAYSGISTFMKRLKRIDEIDLSKIVNTKKLHKQIGDSDIKTYKLLNSRYGYDTIKIQNHSPITGRILGKRNAKKIIINVINNAATFYESKELEVSIDEINKYNEECKAQHEPDSSVR